MIHRQHCIAVFEVLGGEQRVGWQWADQLDALLAQTRQRRLDDFDFLAPQVAAFPGMGIQATDQNARAGDTELAHQVRVQDARDPLQTLGGDRIGDIPERQVGGHQRHTQAARGEHHYHLFGVGQLREKFRMPGEGDTGFVDHAFVHGGGDHAGEVAREAAAGSASQRLQYVGTVGGVELAGLRRRPQWRVPDVEATGWRRMLRPGAGMHLFQFDRQTERCAPRLQQFHAGDGNERSGLRVAGQQ